MNLVLAIYFLGSIISIIISIVIFTSDEKLTEEIINDTNDLISKNLNYYERQNIVNVNTFIALNFFLSWFQVLHFIYYLSPTRLYLKILFLRYLLNIFIFINSKSGQIGRFLVDKHNKLIIDYNKKNEIAND